GPLGYLVWRAVQIIFPNVRAIDTLQILNAVFGATTVVVFYRLLLNRFGSRYIALCFSLALAFSATWWKFATDANSYIPSTCFLMVALSLVNPTRERKPVLLGCIH